MSVNSKDISTSCSWEKAQTCKNRFRFNCAKCNQTRDKQGLNIFADSNIKNYYEEDKEKAKAFKKNARRK